MIEGVTFYSHARDGHRIGNFTKGVEQYRQEWQEGPLEAEFSFRQGDTVPESGLRSWFNNRLMTQIRVHADGREVWRGYVGYMKLSFQGIVYIRDIRKATNTVKVSFNKEADGVSTTRYTDWFIRSESIKKYGLLEEILSYDGNADNILDSGNEPIKGSDGESITEIDLLAEATLDDKADPVLRGFIPLEYDDDDNVVFENELIMIAFGATEMANRITLSDGSLANPDTTGLRSTYDFREFDDGNHGSITTVSREIHRIVDVIGYNHGLYTEEPLLYNKSISQDNDTETIVGVRTNTGAMDRLRTLTMLKDKSGNKYELFVDIDGGVVYRQRDMSNMLYEMRPGTGKIMNKGGAVPTWGAQPGLVQVFGESETLWLPGMPLASNVIDAKRTSMRDGQSSAAFLPSEITELDYLLAARAHKKFIEEFSNDAT